MPRLVETVNGEKQYSWGPPLICMFPMIQLETPQNPGTFVEMPNPLYSFKFPPQANKFDRNAPMAWQATFSNSRQPHSISVNTIRGINGIGKSDHRFVMSTFGANIKSDDVDQPFTGGKLYNLLMNRNVETGQRMGFGEFSNDGYFEAQGQNVGNQNSLEGFHDDIHVNTGSGSGAFSLDPNDRTNYGMGHMGLIEMAAFDPIFWLHHW
jgi:tyrosinase